MAFENFSTISVVLSQLYSARLADQRNMDAVELGIVNLVPNDSGKNVAWVARFSGTKATTNFADGDDVGSGEYGKTDKASAILDFGNYRSPAEIGDQAAVLAAVSGGSPDELRSLIDTEITDSLLQITKDVAIDFYTGTGTNGGKPNIVGLYGGAGINTGTYATIARSGQPEWAGNVIGNAGTPRPITDDLLRQAEVAVFNAGGMAPNVIVTSANVHRKYAGLFTSIQRVATPGPMPAQLGMGSVELYWNNIPVVRSARAPAGKLAMFHSSNVEMVFPPELRSIASVPQNPMVQKMGLDLKREYMLPILVEPLAKTGNSKKYNVFTYVQLRVRRPNGVALITDISES